MFDDCGTDGVKFVLHEVGLSVDSAKLPAPPPTRKAEKREFVKILFA